MTQEALRMALEAMNAMLTHMGMDEDEWNKVTFDQMRQAIKAAEEALAQTQEPVATLFGSLPVYDTTTPQRTEQEPVAYSGNGTAGREADIKPTGFFFQMPKRTWVGLTDDEIAQGWKESWVTEQAFQSAVWWAEDKLKEKNT